MRTILSMVLSIGCSASADAPRRVERDVEERATTAGSEPVEPAAENDPRWHDALTSIGRGYTAWGRVDDQLRFAPGLCLIQTRGRARFTASDDEGTHGGPKLYSVFALDPVAYGMPPTDGEGYALGETSGIVINPPTSPRTRGSLELEGVAQVLVKESFRAEERTLAPGESGHGQLSPATRGGRTYVAGEALGLYVMMRMRDADAPGTDAGWVYGTILPDGTITASGRVRSCMSCHVDAPHDRWFGLPRDTVGG